MHNEEFSGVPIGDSVNKFLKEEGEKQKLLKQQVRKLFLKAHFIQDKVWVDSAFFPELMEAEFAKKGMNISPEDEAFSIFVQLDENSDSKEPDIFLGGKQVLVVGLMVGELLDEEGKGSMKTGYELILEAEHPVQEGNICYSFVFSNEGLWLKQKMARLIYREDELEVVEHTEPTDEISTHDLEQVQLALSLIESRIKSAMSSVNRRIDKEQPQIKWPEIP
ncbi:MAG: hypothetical protein Q7R97_00355 [Candidatus Daviesbacteria bacterium]|nr:hypothetical protein [Candidatus Daviesbacteria bacterium]